ncbi:thioredoxin-related transmembrane protein [Gracilaria domingensis]|nr:thioredoxin-related transmembrane protein [Gracilaria domingensis]
MRRSEASGPLGGQVSTLIHLRNSRHLLALLVANDGGQLLGSGRHGNRQRVGQHGELGDVDARKADAGVIVGLGQRRKHGNELRAARRPGGMTPQHVHGVVLVSRNAVVVRHVIQGDNGLGQLEARLRAHGVNHDPQREKDGDELSVHVPQQGDDGHAQKHEGGREVGVQRGRGQSAGDEHERGAKVDLRLARDAEHVLRAQLARVEALGAKADVRQHERRVEHVVRVQKAALGHVWRRGGAAAARAEQRTTTAVVAARGRLRRASVFGRQRRHREQRRRTRSGGAPPRGAVGARRRLHHGR